MEDDYAIKELYLMPEGKEYWVKLQSKQRITNEKVKRLGKTSLFML